MPAATRGRARAGRGDEAQALTPIEIAKEVNKRWGAGTMMFASDPSLAITRLPSGILSVDVALGGGFARGRHTEIFGGNNLGKTYVTYRLLGETQEAGGTAAFIDVERTFDPKFAESAGVNLATLAFHRQKHGNRVIDFMETLLRGGDYDVIALDSIAALLPKSELEADMDASTMGTAQAKMMSAALRRLTAANNRTALIYINQTRESIGTIFAKKAVTSGGKAMGFYAGTRIELVRTENIKRKVRTIDTKSGDEKASDVVRGHRVLLRIEKDKTGGAIPHSETTFVFDYDLGGIDPVEDLIYLGRHYGLVHKTGNRWWAESYEDETQLGRGKFKKWLRRNVAVAEELEELIRAAAADEREDDDDDNE